MTRKERLAKAVDLERNMLAALAQDPSNAGAARELGVAYGLRNDPDRALEWLRFSAALDPTCAGTWAVLGGVLTALARYDEAGEAFARAAAISPNMPALRWNRCFYLFARGRWDEAWADYEWGKVNDMRPQRHSWPEWRGGMLTGRRLLVWAEQGAGDTFQYVRYLPELKARFGARRVILECTDSLVGLLWRQGLADEVVARRPDMGLPPAGWDEHVSLLSLPGILGVQPDNLCGAPYLTAPGQVELQGAGGMRVGLVWRGNPDHPNDHERSVPKALLDPLLAVPGVSWLALQQECDVGPEDWQQTAAILAGCELVITVDTGVAHLAGALGVPVWMLVTTAPDYRWPREGERTGWYDSMRIFRQVTRGDWPEVIGRVVEELKQRVDARAVRTDGEQHQPGGDDATRAPALRPGEVAAPENGAGGGVLPRLHRLLAGKGAPG